MPDARAHGGFVNAKSDPTIVPQKQSCKVVDDDNDTCIAYGDPLAHRESTSSYVFNLATISDTDSPIPATAIYLRYGGGWELVCRGTCSSEIGCLDSRLQDEAHP